MIKWPDDYLELEHAYCDTELRRFEIAVKEGNAGFDRIAVMNKRDEFNRIWNLTHREQFTLCNRGRNEL